MEATEDTGSIQDHDHTCKNSYKEALLHSASF